MKKKIDMYYMGDIAESLYYVHIHMERLRFLLLEATTEECDDFMEINISKDDERTLEYIPLLNKLKNQIFSEEIQERMKKSMEEDIKKAVFMNKSNNEIH